MTSGLFVTFEGGDGSGKSTQMRRIAARLRGLGHTVVENMEPGGTRIGGQIRNILLSAEHMELSPAAELLLFFASRAQAVEEIIVPALSSGRIVLSDRFTDSSAAYQGVARGLGLEAVEQLDRIACRGLKPDLTLCFDVDIEIGLGRARVRNIEGSRTETRLDDESIGFHRSVRQAYHDLARREPDRVKLVDASGTLDEGEALAWSILEPLVNTRSVG